MASDLPVSHGRAVDDECETGTDHRRSWPAWLVEGGAVVFTVVLHYWVTRGRNVYLATPDEASHLAIARTLSGTRPFHMFGISFDAGYGTLLASVYRLVEDPELAFRFVLMVNVLLALVTLFVVRSLVVRMLGVSPPIAIWCAAAGLALPGAAIQTLYAGSEVLIAFVISLILLLAVRLHGTARPWPAALGLAVAGSSAALVHARLLGVVLAVLLVLAVSGARREIPVRIAVAAGGVLVGLTWLLRLYNSAVHDRVWVAGSPSATHRLSGFFERLDPGEILASGGGMVWHQLVATFGLALVGLGYLLVTAVRRDSRPRVGATELQRWKVLLILASSALPAMVWIAERPIAGQMVYGRYWAPLAVPVVAIGAAWLVVVGSRRSAMIIAVSVLVTGVFSVGFFAARQDAITAAFDERGFRSPRRIVGLLSYVAVGDRIEIAVITTRALAVMAVLLGIATLAGRYHRVVIVTALVGLATMATVRASLHMDDAGGLHAARWRPAMELVDDGVLPEDATVAFQLERSRWELVGPEHAFAGYQFYQPDVEFVGLRGEAVLDHRWVVADRSDALLREEGWDVAYVHPDGRGLVIWENPRDAGSG